MDQLSLCWANHLLQNSEQAAGIECAVISEIAADRHVVAVGVKYTGAI
jgi:allophanate hydrolase subunit 2